MAPRRLRPGRSRTARREAGRRERGRTGRGAVVDLRRLPHQPVATGKKLHLATSTYRGYERNVQLHILPVLGRISIRRLRYQQIESLYDTLLHPKTGRGLAPKTVYEIHLIIRGALADAIARAGHAQRRARSHAHPDSGPFSGSKASR